jgi:hypothetical protein
MEFPTQPDHAVGLAIQPSGDVFVAGVFDAEARWGDTTLAPSGRADGFVLRVSASGEPASASRLGVEGRLLLRAVSALPGGGALLAGKLDGGGPVGKGGAALAALGKDDILLVTLDP